MTGTWIAGCVSGLGIATIVYVVIALLTDTITQRERRE